jgi:hypothetical protein
MSFVFGAERSQENSTRRNISKQKGIGEIEKMIEKVCLNFASIRLHRTAQQFTGQRV